MQKKIIYHPWVICSFASLFFFYEFIQMSIFNAIGHQLLQNFQIRSTALAGISAAYFYGMIAFLFPAGFLLDRFSTKRLILSALSLSVLGTFLFSLTHSLFPAMACRFLSGIGGAFAFLSCIKLTSQWLPSKHISFAIGLWITFAFLGGAIAQTPFTLLSTIVGWAFTLKILSALGVIILFLISLFVHDFSAPLVQQKKDIEKNTLPFHQSFSLASKNKYTWLAGLYIMLMNLPIITLGAVWGDLYLTEHKQLSHIQASYVTSMLFFGMIIGSPIFGLLADKIQKRKAIMLAGSIFAFLISLFLFVSNNQLSLLMLLFFFLGLAASAQGIGYPCIVENNPICLAGTASGLASILIMGGGACLKILFGWILDQNWNGVMLNNAPFYSSQAFKMALLLFPSSFFVAILIVCTMSDK